MVFVMVKKASSWDDYERWFPRLLLDVGFEVLEIGDGSKL